MRREPLSRRELLEWTARHGLLLTGAGRALSARAAEGEAQYPEARLLRGLDREGWVVEYRKEDSKREGLGLRAPSAVPADKFVSTPAIIEAQFNARGRITLVMPRYASVCNQTALASRVEVEAGSKVLKNGEDYSARTLVTRPLGNRFWQLTGFNFPEKVPVRVRVIGVISNPAAPRDLAAVKGKIAARARAANQFEKRHQVPGTSHYLKKPGDLLVQTGAAARGPERQGRFETLLHILEYTHKRGQLTKGTSRDPEAYVKDGMKGSCGANADFVNFAGHSAGLAPLFYTESFVVVPRLDYLGLHVWNLACCNGLFIADSLHPDLFFPQWSGYVATSVGPNIGHPAGPDAATSGGYVTGDYAYDYFVYFSQPNYGLHGKELNKFQIPEAIARLGEFVAAQRARVNRNI